MEKTYYEIRFCIMGYSGKGPIEEKITFNNKDSAIRSFIRMREWKRQLEDFAEEVSEGYHKFMKNFSYVVGGCYLYHLYGVYEITETKLVVVSP